MNPAPVFSLVSLACLVAASYSLYYAIIGRYRRWLRFAGVAALLNLTVIYGYAALIHFGILPDGGYIRSGLPTASGIFVLVALHIAEIITCRKRS